MRSLFILLLALSLTACASTEESRSSPKQTEGAIKLGQLDNKQASHQLYLAMVKQGYLAQEVGEAGVAVQFGKHQFLLEPHMDAKGINRVLMNRFYAIHPSMQGSEQLLILVGSLNQKLNFAKFVLREKGAVVQVQSAATFTESIELEEIRRFMLWTSDGLKHVASSMPQEAGEVIKPIPIMKSLELI